MDRNHDGVVTIDEFLDCCRCDQAITNSMLVFDSTIWPSGNELEGNRRNFTSSMTSQRAQDERVPQSEHHQQPCGPISSASVKSNIHSTTKNFGNGSSRSKLCDNQSHKNLSPSFGVNPKRNGSTQQQYQHLHHPHHPVAVFGNKTKNNIGHKASQTKRIQLSTAAKRCKSINRSKAVDNNNSKAVNPSDNCKAAGASERVRDDKCVTVVNTPNHGNNLDIETIATNSLSTQSTESPTLVKVKTWYTAESVALPPSQDEIFWYWTYCFFPPSLFKKTQTLSHHSADDDNKMKFRQFFDLPVFIFFFRFPLFPLTASSLKSKKEKENIWYVVAMGSWT